MTDRTPRRARSPAAPAASAAGAAGDTRRRARWRPPTPEEVGRAAALCYANVGTDEQVARRLGISRRTLARWKKRPEFVAAATAVLEFHRRELERECRERLRQRLGAWPGGTTSGAP